MSLLNRIANITKAAVHEALDKLENPVMMTSQYLRNLEDDIYAAKAQLADQRIAVKVLGSQQEEALRMAEQIEEAALAAMTSGDEAAARRAVEAKLRHTERANTYGAQKEAAIKRVAELEIQLEAAKEELERLKKKRDELAERARKVEEQNEMQRPNFSQGLDYGDAARGFERMEEKITGWEAQQQVAASYHATEMETKRAEIDAEMDRLHSKLTNTSKTEPEA